MVLKMIHVSKTIYSLNQTCDRMSFLLLLLRFLLHVCLLEVDPISIGLNFPLPVFVLFQLALLVQLSKQVFGLESVLRLSLLELKSLLELSVLLFQFFCSLFLAQFFFFQLGELCSRSSALRADLQEVNAFAVRC